MSNLNDIFEEEEELIIQRPKSKHKNLRDPDFPDIGLPDEIIHAAKHNYRLYGVPTHKGINRNKILYGCILIASMQKDYPLVPHQLMKKLGFDMSKRNDMSNIVKDIQAKVETSYRVYTPVYMAKAYLLEKGEDLALLEEIESIWKKIEDNPQVKLFDIKTVAVWLLLQFNLATDKEICEHYGVSYQKFRKIGVILAGIHNEHSV